MLVFKFGGASVKNAESIRNVSRIIQKYHNHLLIVISALGKTTNDLEEVLRRAFYGTDDPAEILNRVRNVHYEIVEELFEFPEGTIAKLDVYFDDILSRINDLPTDYYDYEYDQIVSRGELLSSIILSDFLITEGLNVKWLDARQLIITDHTYRQAEVDFGLTANAVEQNLKPELDEFIVITQGFIGSTRDNQTTTLGREGSDYSAAIFANLLDAEKLTVWKDVPGVLNADPRYFKDTVKIDRLSYYEAVEMTYYGAKVIHPKTLKPLKEKNIPCEVKSFDHPDEQGTLIANFSAEEISPLPPVIVLKREQVLLSFVSRDFSFITEDNVGHIYTTCASLHLTINLMQAAALMFSIAIDDAPDKIDRLIEKLEGDYAIKQNAGLDLLTIRHYDNDLIDKHTSGREIILLQKSRHTVQLLLR